MKDTALRIATALALLFAAAALRAQDDAVALARQAKRLLAREQWAEALTLLDRCLALDPKQFEPTWMRAFTKGRLGDHDGAIADAARAIELDPRDHRGFQERGINLYCTGKRAAALADYDRAIALAPDVAGLHGERGDILLESDEPGAAIEAFTAAIGLAPEWSNAWTGRGRAALALADFAAARRDFTRSSELAPAEAAVWRLRSGAEYDCRDDTAALRSAQEFVDRVPASVRGFALALRGRLAWRIGDLALANANLQDAARDQPVDAVAADALLTLGCVRLGAGDQAAAATSFAAAAPRAPESDAAWYLLMRWCTDARADGLEAAGARLQAGLRDRGDKVSRLQQESLAVCTRGEDADIAPAVVRDNPFEACPRLFFAAWRAECAGDRARRNDLLLRCVNTGAKDWLQWATAVALLRGDPDGARLRPSFGAEFERVADGAKAPTQRMVVRSVAPGGAADCQGLAPGDEIVALAGRAITNAAWRAIDAQAREGLDLRLTRRRGDATAVVMFRLGLARD